MSEETGGSVFTVDKDHTLSQVLQRIQDKRRSQYSLAHKSTNGERNGEFRSVESMPRNGNYEVQGRKGYYATESRAR